MFAGSLIDLVDKMYQNDHTSIQQIPKDTYLKAFTQWKLLYLGPTGLLDLFVDHNIHKSNSKKVRVSLWNKVLQVNLLLSIKVGLNLTKKKQGVCRKLMKNAEICVH